METKPLHVRAYEAVFGTVADEIANGVRPYDIDDAAALHLLKAWRNGSGLRAALVSFKVDGTYRVELFHDGMMFHGDDPSLARAICLALIAAKESH